MKHIFTSCSANLSKQKKNAVKKHEVRKKKWPTLTVLDDFQVPHRLRPIEEKCIFGSIFTRTDSFEKNIESPGFSDPAQVPTYRIAN